MTQSSSTFKYLNDRQVAARFGVGRATVWRWLKTSNFPAPVKLSPGCTRWLLTEVEEWAKAQEDGRAQQ